MSITVRVGLQGMRKKLETLNGLVRRAHKAAIFERATLAMSAVDTAADLLAEIVSEIEQLKGQIQDIEADIEAKGGVKV